MRLGDLDALLKLVPPEEIVARMAIMNAPTVEERPTGEWIEEPDTLGVIEKGNAKYRCSCCGRTDIQAKSLDVPYCWFCGAEMAEKDIDED